MSGLPKFVVLKSKPVGRYLHFLWNDEFGVYVNDLGAKRDLDPVNPFVKLEVVPSAADPTLVHLRCSFNGKFVHLVSAYGVLWLSATAAAADEDKTKPTSTLFRPIFPPGEPNTVGFLHVQSDRHVRLFGNKEYDEYINNVACAYSNDGAGFHRFEFAAWVPYDEQIKAKDDEIQKHKDAAAAVAGESLGADAIVEELRKEIREQNVQLEAAYAEIDALKAAAKGK